MLSKFTLKDLSSETSKEEIISILKNDKLNFGYVPLIESNKLRE